MASLGRGKKARAGTAKLGRCDFNVKGAQPMHIVGGAWLNPKRSAVPSPGQVGALRAHCCSADTMKPSQGGREETPMHLCRRHKGPHIPGDWWP